MQATLTTTLTLPLALAVVMFGLGLSLRGSDFTRVLAYPRAVWVGLAVQVLVLPLAAAGIAHLFNLPPVLAVGLMLLAASPGGAMANLYSHLAGGDVALNVTLTAVSSVLTAITLPIIVGLSTLHFMGAGQDMPLQFGKVAQVVALVLTPVALGMLVNLRAPSLSARLRGPMKIVSIVVLAAVVGVAALQNRQDLVAHVRAVGAACLAFNLVSLAAGYGLPRLLKLDRRQAVAIGMEVGIHNAALAIAIALSPSLLNSPQMAVPAAVYGAMMFFTAAGFGWLTTRGKL
ncbi:bile acid:sodium symporter [Caulobacter mirabilis]|uniref:Bile acid:sodium symporter n=1 Tax=Caulobacter mirabilis TaxID=69666 RepID=A0A2D2AW83_9CAUL|nr:bile acid:sodium symporter [Caulobacter mirabilis]